MDNFKVPEHIPQDLLLIHGLIGQHAPPTPRALSSETPAEDNCADSSDSDNASEHEIEAELLVNQTDNDPPLHHEPADSNTDSDTDSHSDESDDEQPSLKADIQDHDNEEDGEFDPAPTAGVYVRTKHEVVQSDIIVPDIEEVGPEEDLEKVGEIMNIIDNLVVIKGVPSEIANRGSERALDSDTLLVFDDRKVMGYIFETFGRTSQPLYQVKFSHEYPLDLERVRISREVFHVPRRSNFVFVSQMKRLKGSDASNVHDEEPAEDELEFSDDEAEAAYKSSLKRKRGEFSRANSVTSSRQQTPTPSQVHDQDLVDDAFFSTNAYDEHGLYDTDFSTMPARPPPIPYDDPYSDEYNGSTSSVKPISTLPDLASGSLRVTNQARGTPLRRESERAVGRGRGRGTGQERDVWSGRESSGRGRGRRNERGGDRGRNDRGQAPPRSINEGDVGVGWPTTMPNHVEPYSPRSPWSHSPASFAAGHATGQYVDGSHFVSQAASFSDAERSWAFHQPLLQPPPRFDSGTLGYQQSFVQPHINPRFASAFGINLGLGQAQLHSPDMYGENLGSIPERRGSNFADEWVVHETISQSCSVGERKAGDNDRRY